MQHGDSGVNHISMKSHFYEIPGTFRFSSDKFNLKQIAAASPTPQISWIHNSHDENVTR